MNNLPFEIFDNIKKYVIFKPITNYDIDNAINLWFSHNEKANKLYGHLSLWDLSNFDNNYINRFYNNLMNENYMYTYSDSQYDNFSENSDDMSNYSYFDNMILSDDEDDFNDNNSDDMSY